MSNAVRTVVVAFALVLAACAALRQQRSQPVRTDQGEFKNLKVLPQNITHDELIATMRGFARALGVRCNNCHVPIPGESGDDAFDFPSDANPKKNIARTMIRMTRTINHDYIAHVSRHPDNVTCWTCHRGKKEPELGTEEKEGGAGS